jgi:Protein of unknown function (DUF3383)
MSLIDEIVQVTIAKDTLGITYAGLNTLLILGDTNKKKSGVKRIKLYGDIAEVVSDFATHTPEYRCAKLAFSQDTKLPEVLIGQCFDTESFADAYNAITLKNKDFYGVVITSKKAEDQLAIAELAEMEEKIFGLSSSDSKILNANDTESILYSLKEANNFRSFVIYNGAADLEYPEAGWFGLMFGKKAGSATWAYKSLNGVGVSQLTTNDRTVINNKNGNYFVSMGGIGVMLEGKTTKGEYIDIIQGLDWLTNNMQSKIANALLSSDKIPYTNQGIAIIESMVRNSLNEAVGREIIDESSIKVEVPDIRDISPSERNSRILPDVTFEARLSGAIHKIIVQGTVSV